MLECKERNLDILSAIRRGLPHTLLEEWFCFARHVTIGCGGHALCALYPRSVEELAQALLFLQRENIPFCKLGAGANVLPQDGVFQGVVVRFCKLDVRFYEGRTLFAGAGVPLGALLRLAREGCIGGLEPFSGIPASVGGATAMNAGIPVRHFGDLVERVLAVRGGEIVLLKREECRFSQKDSAFLHGDTVAGVYVRGALSDRDQIARESCYYRTRRARLPKGRSMGCVFVNPQGESAGALIERCGLKGLRQGRAYISPVHANFIINEGDSAQDVAALIERVKAGVLQKTGIALREEIRRIP